MEEKPQVKKSKKKVKRKRKKRRNRPSRSFTLEGIRLLKKLLELPESASKEDIIDRICDKHQEIILRKKYLENELNKWDISKEDRTNPVGEFRGKVEHYFEVFTEPRYQEFSNFLCNFLFSQYPGFDYRFYTHVNPALRVNFSFSPDITFLITLSKMELHFEGSYDPTDHSDSFLIFFRHLHQLSDKNDWFESDKDAPQSRRFGTYTLQEEGEDKERDIFEWEIHHGFPLEKICMVKIKVKIACAKKTLLIGYGLVHRETGNCRLVIDNRPFIWSGEPLKIGTKTYFTIKRSRKQALIATKVIELLQEAVKAEIGSTFVITNYGGWLNGHDLRIFRKNYQANKELAETERLRKALSRTAFAKVRKVLGVDKMSDIIILSWDGNGLPTTVFIPYARPRNRKSGS